MEFNEAMTFWWKINEIHFIFTQSKLRFNFQSIDWSAKNHLKFRQFPPNLAVGAINARLISID